jgi:hypothetical protein
MLMSLTPKQRRDTSDTSARLEAKQAAMRERLHEEREQQKAKRQEFRKLADRESSRQRRRRKKREAAMLDALCKSPHGGARLNAGRKPEYFRELGIKPISAEQLLEALDVPKIVESLINDRNPAIRLQTMALLWNRAYGLPRTTGEIEVTGRGTTRIAVEFVHSKDGEPALAQNGPALLKGQTATSSEPAPVSETQPPPPLPEPMGSCRFHGDFRLAESGGKEICPQYAEKQERWLAGLMPGGSGRQ